MFRLYVNPYELHVTEHQDGEKMQGMNSINTSALLNPFCAACAKCPGCICEHCYARSMENQFKKLEQYLIRNAEILSAGIIPVEYLPVLPYIIMRINSMGELINETNCENIVNTCEKNPHCTFTIWTKRLTLLGSVLDRTGKPDNLVIGVSSPELNTPVEIPEKHLKYVDFRFTVYTAEYAIDNDISINCGFKKCIECRNCYGRHERIFEVNEILKSDSARYFSILAHKTNVKAGRPDVITADAYNLYVNGHAYKVKVVDTFTSVYKIQKTQIKTNMLPADLAKYLKTNCNGILNSIIDHIVTTVNPIKVLN